MRIAVGAESRPGERRVALVPGLVSRLIEVGLEVVVELGAGVAAGFTDVEYRDAGAVVDSGALDGAGVVLSVWPLSPGQVGRLGSAAITISFLPTAQELELVGALRAAGHTGLAMELVPRISRAQGMDALSSQAFVAGYRAVLVA
ncbi:MAG: NAD(P)(+) transhydrogenase (Re/Si-specific) subunit alpha, partial [Actinophytocola sp.]